MKINCAIINDDHNSPIVNFLKLKNFSFLDIKSIYEKKCDKLTHAFLKPPNDAPSSRDHEHA